MKKIAICITLFCALIALVAVVVVKQKPNHDVVRIHIRANSNSNDDQAVKYVVRDLVVQYLTPKLSEVLTRSQAVHIIETEKKQMQHSIDATLQLQGFSYRSNIVFKDEEFPSRVYNGITFESGLYSAIIVELGQAKGDNWWCVMYPPLCFIGAQSNGTDKVEFRSWIYEWIRQLSGQSK